MNLLLFSILILIGAFANAGDTTDDKVKSISEKIIGEYMNNYGVGDSAHKAEYYGLFYSILDEERYEVLAALELNRIGQQYLTMRYAISEVPDSNIAGIERSLADLGLDRKSLVKEHNESLTEIKNQSTFEFHDRAKLEELLILTEYLQNKIKQEIKAR